MISERIGRGAQAPRSLFKAAFITAFLSFTAIFTNVSCGADNGVSTQTDLEIDEESEVETGPYCEPGRYECSLSDRIVCNETGDGWTYVETCGAGCSGGECLGGDEEIDEMDSTAADEEPAEEMEPQEEESGGDTEEFSDATEPEKEEEFIAEIEEEECFKDLFYGNGAEDNAKLIVPPVNYTNLTVCGWEDDWFAVDIPQGYSLKVSTAIRDFPGDVDIKLYVKGHNGLSDYVAAAMTRKLSDALIYNNAAAGRYFIRIQGFDKPSLYSLSASVSINGFGEGSDTCASPAPLYFGVGKDDSTLSAYDNYHCSCSPALGAEVVYKLSAPYKRNAKFTLNATFDAIIYVRKTCDGEGSESGCSDNSHVQSGETETLTIQNMEPGDYFVFIDGYGIDDGGTFTLKVE